MGGGTDGIAHVVQAIENGNEVIILSGKFLGFGDLEGDAISDIFALGRFARARDGLVVDNRSRRTGTLDRPWP